MLSPLFKLAVISGAQPAVRFHIQRGIDINSKDADGRSPLMLAALKGHIEICKILLSAGADPTAVDRDGNDALSLALGSGGTLVRAIIQEHLPNLDEPAETVSSHPKWDENGFEIVNLGFADAAGLDPSKWEVDIESSAPTNDATCQSSAYAIQQALAEHFPLDISEDWSDVEISLPVFKPRRFWEEIDADIQGVIRQLFVRALSTGEVSICELEAVVPGNRAEENDDFVAGLLLIFGEMGVWIETNPIWQEVTSQDDLIEDEFEVESDAYRLQSDEAVLFMQDLNSAVGDPYNAYLKDIGRHDPLSREKEAELSGEIEAGLAEMVSAISECAPALAEIIRVSEAICRSELPLAYMVDKNASNEGGSHDQLDSTVDEEPDLIDIVDEKACGPVTGAKLDVLASRLKTIRELYHRIYIEENVDRSVLSALTDALTPLNLSWKFAEQLCKVAAQDEREVETPRRINAGIERAKRARTEFVEANLRLVISIARKYRNCGIALPDLIQAGNLGLLTAVCRFDRRKGFKFSTFGTWWIRQSISRMIANEARTIRLPVHILESIKKLKGMQDQLSQRLQREAEPEELADQLGMSEATIRKLLSVPEEPIPIYIEFESEGEPSAFSGLFPDDPDDSPFNQLSNKELKLLVAKLVGSLPGREGGVLKMRFGLGDDKECTLEEIGIHFNLTRERIRQIEQKALRKLRHPSRNYYLRPFANRLDLLEDEDNDQEVKETLEPE